MTQADETTAGCPFCQIVSGALPHHIIDEDEGWIAFLNIAPAAPGHTLVVPRKHAAHLWDLDPVSAAGLGVGLQRVGRLIEDRLRPDGLSVFQSNREAGWQSVFHVHFHLVPRAVDDDLKPSWITREGDPVTIAGMAKRLARRTTG